MRGIHKHPIVRFTVAAVAGLMVSATAVAQPSRGDRSDRGDRQQGNERRGGGMMGGQWGMGMSMQPDYMLRDLRRFSEALDLNDDQQAIVEQILRDYDESFREATDASREAMRESFGSMRSGEDSEVRQQDVRSRMTEIREKIQAARNLSGEQNMDELRERLEQEMSQARDEMRQQHVEQWQSPERQAAFEQIGLLTQDQLRLKRLMRDEFEGDLQAILTEDQISLWPPLRRMLVRDRLLPRGRLSGENVDVMGLVDGEDFDDQALMELLPVLDAWDHGVTAALEARDDHMVSIQGMLMQAMQSMDVNSGMDAMREQAQLAEAVRDINDSAVDQISQILPEEIGNEFRNDALQRGYPRVFRRTRTERALRGALELDGLDEDVAIAINDLITAFTAELTVANDSLLRVTRRWEADEQLERMSRWSARMTGAGGDRVEGPVAVAEGERRQLEDRYMEQLRSLLTAEQIEALGGLRTDRDRQGWQRGEGRQNDRGNRDRGSGGGDFGGREEFMNRFDSNGDGQLDESEREQIREHFRGRDRGGQGGQGGRGGQGGQGGRGGQPPTD